MPSQYSISCQENYASHLMCKKTSNVPLSGDARLQLVSAMLSLFMFIVSTVPMTLPRMTPSHQHCTVLFRSVQNPEPHDGAHALADARMPSFRGVEGQSTVSDVVSAVPSSSCHGSRIGSNRSPDFQPNAPGTQCKSAEATSSENRRAVLQARGRETLPF